MKHFSYDPFTAARRAGALHGRRAAGAGRRATTSSIRSTNAKAVGHHATRSVDLAVPR